jgi:SpoIID/LytB domain protein
MSDVEICFAFSGAYHCEQTGEPLSGMQRVRWQEGQIYFHDRLFDRLVFIPETETAFFTLHEVTIGIQFHWERSENQDFSGTLIFIVEENHITAINKLPVEDYLFSVIASEMSATASLNLLKAHAVISRSWLLSPMLNPVDNNASQTEWRTETSLIKWYERDAHSHFDVCADDHCQRYQGLTKARTPLVRQAITETRGEALTFDGKICDARYSKSCGGQSECFRTCWAEADYPYLQPVADILPASDTVDLTTEANADRWIRSEPAAFCNTKDRTILAQTLNNYDQETTDFYRWRVSYTQQALSDLIRRRSGMDFGLIQELIPLERGTSGRIVRLKIVGDCRTMTVGKELEIRKWLSETHLYSSAFVVDKSSDNDFTLIGSGWGHGVGLCQIGAAVMGSQGYSYRDILLHYFRGACIEKLYK